MSEELPLRVRAYIESSVLTEFEDPNKPEVRRAVMRPIRAMARRRGVKIADESQYILLAGRKAGEVQLVWVAIPLEGENDGR